jgi:hypothetical protein
MAKPHVNSTGAKVDEYMRAADDDNEIRGSELC